MEPRSYRPRDQSQWEDVEALRDNDEDFERERERERKRRAAPSKLTRAADTDLLSRGAGPAKRSLVESGGISPSEALGYTRWLLSPSRGWSTPLRPGASAELRIDRRATGTLEEEQLPDALELVAAAGSGEPLPEALRQQLARELGADLSMVRVHHDERAHQAAAALQAQAFTIGHEIYFARGAYDPTSSTGVELIAHEAAHVAQNQQAFSSGGAKRVSDPGDAHERSAEDFASRFVETYTGDAARAAAGMIAATASALRSIVGIAEETPQRQRLLGQLDQVIGLGDERAFGPAAARSHGAATTAATSVIHRAGDDKPAQTAPKWTVTEAAKRVKLFVDDTALVPRRTGADPVFAKVDDVTTFFKDTSADRWQRADYVSKIKSKLSAPIPPDTDLEKDLEAVHAAGLVPGLVLNAKSWGWINPSETPPKEVKFVGTLAYEHKSVSEKYDDYVTTLHETKYLKPPKPKLSVTFKNSTTVTFSKTETAKPNTETDLSKCRQAIRDAALDVEEYKMKADHGWDNFFADIIEGPKTKFPAGFQGDLFGMIAARDLGHQVSRQEIYFDDSRLNLNEDDRRADGLIDGDSLKLTEFKGYSSSPDLGDGSKLAVQAQNYAKIVALKVTAKKVDPPSKKGPFHQVAYIFPTKEMSKQWASKLKAIFEKEGVGNALRVFPAAEGSGVATLKVNPTFEVPLKDDKQTTHNIAAPEMLHPGLTFSKLELRTKAPGDTTVESGNVEIATNLGGAVTGEKQKKPIAAGGTIENKLGDLKSSLSNIWKSGRIKADAKLVDGGVEGTITVTEGPSGIPKINLQQSTLTVTYKGEGALTVTGTVGLATADGKIHGNVTVGWNGADWTFTGNVTVEAGVIKSVDQFTAMVSYDAGKWTLGIDSLTISQKIKAVTLTGKLMGVRYDVEKGDFSGMAQLDADLGVFGKASAEAKVEKNKLTHAVFSYDSPELKYPAKSEKPALKGTIGGTLTYDDGQFSGAVRGTAGINVPALEKIAGESGLGLRLDGQIHPDGHFSGSIGTTSPLKLGKHFEIPSVACTIKDNGDVEGDFKIKIVDFKYLEKVEVGCKIDKNGISISDAAVKVAFGTEADRVHGSIDVAFSQATGFAITGTMSVKIKEGMVATGTLAYDSKTQTINAELKVDEITLLKHGPVTKSLFKFAKQIPLVSIYGLGVYLDIGFNLDFNYEFDLRLAPKVKLEGLSVETFEYKEIKAEIELLGLLAARLVATPKVGLGLFALSPSLLRGGGGVMIPITGEALLKPKGKLTVGYAPNGGVSGDAELGMSLTFGIKGSVNPYANVSLLDGVWDKEWKGESLADFEIMPPKELFNFQLNLNNDMKKQDPQIPDSPGAPQGGGGKQLPQEKPVTRQEGQSTADRNAAVPSSGPSGAGGGLPDEPVKLGSMTDRLKNLQGYKTIEAIMKKAGAAWEKIKGFFGRVAKAFQSFFDGLASGIEEIIDGFSNEGLAYLPKLVKKIVGPTTWEVVEPLINAVAQNADKMLSLFETDPPTGAGDYFQWALKLVAKAWGLAFESIGSLVSALNTMFSRLGGVAVKLITKMVADGMIGVKRHTYWLPAVSWSKGFHKNYFFAATQYKIHVLGVNIDFYDEGNITDPQSVVAIGLFEALERMGVPSNSGYFDERIGEHSKDRWA